MSAPSAPAPPLTVGALIESRAADPTLAGRSFLIQDERVLSYRAYRDECRRTAHFLLGRLGPTAAERPGHVAMILENHIELLSLYGGCAMAGHTLFGVNTGLSGDPLAGVLNQSRARLLVVDQRFADRVERVRDQLEHLGAKDVLVLRTEDAALDPQIDFAARLDDEVGPAGDSFDAPAIEVSPRDNLMVIYTSGTTGLPKGINNDHTKLCLIGLAVSRNLELGPGDRGYACMPLYHSNAMFLGFQPALTAGASLVVRERFSASRFVPDVFEHGVTYWNYVGEPLHYILGAIEAACGGDEERIRAEVTENPKNRLAYALGNGASPPDIDSFSRWMGLEDMLELYGSTEAAISTFRRRGDPRGTVGEVSDPAVVILDESGRECPPAELDAGGKITNYAAAVGEICRAAADASLFQGYYENENATHDKFRDGVYHSGDLGHIAIHEGRRFLYFDGRTGDWIRKDGENFSAGQVGRLLGDHPDVVLAAAYGVPCAVSDELVMAALKLRPEVRFDPAAFFDYCEAQVTGGSLDRKWFPDFVRVVEEFPYTQTQKVLVRELKRDHFDRRRLVDEPIFWRRRGDDRFHPFSAADFEALREEFAAAEREDLLDR